MASSVCSMSTARERRAHVQGAMTYDGRRHEYLCRLDILSHPSIHLVHGITVKRQLCILIICSSTRDPPQPPPYSLDASRTLTSSSLWSASLLEASPGRAYSC